MLFANMIKFIENTDLKNITLFCQDWGGLIGLRLAAKYGDRFEKIVAANTGLPTGNQPFKRRVLPCFVNFYGIIINLHVGGQVRNGTTKGIDENALAAYNEYNFQMMITNKSYSIYYSIFHLELLSAEPNKYNLENI